jgi:hypothetical protein
MSSSQNRDVWNDTGTHVNLVLEGAQDVGRCEYIDLNQPNSNVFLQKLQRRNALAE